MKKLLIPTLLSFMFISQMSMAQSIKDLQTLNSYGNYTYGSAQDKTEKMSQQEYQNKKNKAIPFNDVHFPQAQSEQK